MICPICHDIIDIDKKDDNIETICKHLFHKTCFYLWNNTNCPYCRTELKINNSNNKRYKVIYKYSGNYFSGILTNTIKHNNNSYYLFKNINDSLYTLPQYMYVNSDLINLENSDN